MVPPRQSFGLVAPASVEQRLNVAQDFVVPEIVLVGVPRNERHDDDAVAVGIFFVQCSQFLRVAARLSAFLAVIIALGLPFVLQPQIVRFQIGGGPARRWGLAKRAHIEKFEGREKQSSLIDDHNRAALRQVRREYGRTIAAARIKKE